MSDRLLELRHLRMLVALAETGSVSRAAQRVHLTQSAVSHQLRVLGAHYGMPLVHRRGATIELTDTGKRLAAVGTEVLAAIQAAERDVARLAKRPAGALRTALECHTCFDWLMPVMDGFRANWPEIELDLVSGFHSDPLQLLEQDRADVVIVSDRRRRRGIVYQPLFRFEILLVLPLDHRLARRRHIRAADVVGETLITYPVPEDRIDFIRQVLAPAGVKLERRTTELTVAILQLVASRRGIAALPNWGIKNYIDYEYVVARRIGPKGLWSELYAATTREAAEQAYIRDFIDTARNTCFATLDGLVPIT